MKAHTGVCALAIVTVLLALGARHAVPPPTAGTPRQYDRVTIGVAPVIPPGWTQLELGEARRVSSLANPLQDRAIPPEFVAQPAPASQPARPGPSYNPARAPSSRSPRRPDGLSGDSGDAWDLPPVVTPLEPTGWLVDSMRDLDAARPAAKRNSNLPARDSLSRPRTPGMESGADGAADWLMPGYDVEDDGLAPRRPANASRRPGYR